MAGGLKASKVRAALAQKLEVALGAEVQVATAPDQVSPPCLLIGLLTIEYHAAYARGLDAAELPITLILPRVHDQQAVDTADELISGSGARSVLQILQSDQTLGGACQALVVKRADPESFLSGTTDLPAYRWTVEVYG
jgi:hypothetical protein